jgi:hypothetical protein
LDLAGPPALGVRVRTLQVLENGARVVLITAFSLTRWTLRVVLIQDVSPATPPELICLLVNTVLFIVTFNSTEYTFILRSHLLQSKARLQKKCNDSYEPEGHYNNIININFQWSKYYNSNDKCLGRQRHRN